MYIRYYAAYFFSCLFLVGGVWMLLLDERMAIHGIAYLVIAAIIAVVTGVLHLRKIPTGRFKCWRS